MEFTVFPLPTIDIKRPTLAADAFAAVSGLRLTYALAHQNVAFPSLGSLVIALRQPVQLQLGTHTLQVPKHGAYFILPAARRPAADNEASNHLPGVIQARCGGPMLVISASEVTWRVLCEQLTRHAGQPVLPIAGLWPATRALGLWALATVRHAKVTAHRGTLEPIELLGLAQAMQRALDGFSEHVDRCPGRWNSQKLNVFRRLARVQQYIDLHCTDTLAIETLASMANYSRSHFMSVYRSVFQQTPHAQVIERRLHFARRVLQTGVSVREATLAAGFEDRSSFSKLYRRRFGVSAKEHAKARDFA